MIYFDNSATTGTKPLSVIKSVNNALKYYSANPGRGGHNVSLKASEIVFNTRTLISDYFNADGPEHIIFTKNCTESINILLKGIIEKGDHVITTDLEHNAVIRPLNTMGVDYSVATVSIDNDEKTVNSVNEKIKSNTKLIIVTGASNVIGRVLPLKKIGETARKNNILFAVDGAQICGILPVDVKNMNIDFLAVAPHKGFYAPMGTGILVAQKDIKKTITEGGTGTDSVNPFQPDIMPEKLESGTINLPGIAGIKAGVEFIKKRPEIYPHEIKLVQDIYAFLKECEYIKLYTPFPESNKYTPVLSFNFDFMNSAVAASALNEFGIAVRAGLHCAPVAHRKINTIEIGTVRLSPSVFNSNKEVEYFKKTIQKIYKNRKKYIE